MGDAKIIITASPELASWMKLDLGAGQTRKNPSSRVQPAQTNAERVNWCCHIMRNGRDSGEYTLIGIETFSQYIILIPFPFAPPLNTLESVFRRRWMDDLIHLMLLSHHVEQPQVISVTNQFKQYTQMFAWKPGHQDTFREHFEGAAYCVRQYLQENALDSLDSEQARDLGLYITRLQNREMTTTQEQFYPLARFVEDGLYRFAHGLTKRPFPDTPEGNFPCPHRNPAPQQEEIEEKKVVSLANYRKQKPEDEK